MTTESRPYYCRDDRYDADGENPYASPADFVAMVREVFGAEVADALIVRTSEVLDPDGTVVLQ